MISFQERASLESIINAGQDRPRLRVAMCPPSFQAFQSALMGGGADATHLIQAYVATKLRERGHKLTFLSIDDKQRLVVADHEDNPSIPRQTWSLSSWFRLASGAAWKAQQLIGVPYLNVFNNLRLYDASMQSLQAVDLVYERSFLYRTGIARAAKRLDLPYVLYVEADDLMELDIMGEPITGLLRYRARTTGLHNFRKADRIICVSDQLKKRLVNHWGIGSGKISVLPNVADVNIFKPDPVTRDAFRSEMGIGKKPLIVFVGNFYKWHDVGTLLHAVAALKTSHPDIKLVLVGDGRNRDSMERLSEDLGLSSNAHFTGLISHTEVPRVLAAADIAVVPYPQLEADLWLSPLKLFEYMASGLAIVASETGQITNVLKEEQNALLVPPEDSAAMAFALQRLIEEESTRRRLGKQARLDAVAKHSWDDYITQLEQLLYQTYDAVRFQTQEQ